MPTRYLKPGICDSETIDQCSPLAECLFYRLLVTVDDFGRADARPKVIKAKCFPIKDAVNADKVQKLLQELVEAGLIFLYTSNDCQYLQMLKWDNQPRAKESKFPAPDNICIQLHTSAKHLHTVLPETETETETETLTGTGTDKRAGADDVFETFWRIYPKKTGKGAAKSAWAKIKPSENLIYLIEYALRWQKDSEQWCKDGGQYIPNPSTYLNQQRWLDEPTKQTMTPRAKALFGDLMEGNGNAAIEMG